MSVRRRLFIAMASFIVGMGFLFAFITQIVQRDILTVMVEAARNNEIQELSSSLASYYKNHNDSWEGIEDVEASTLFSPVHESVTSILLLTDDHNVIYTAGDTAQHFIKRFGIRSNLTLNDGKAVTMYYFDSGVDYMSKLRLGILHSTKVLLIIGMIIFTLVSLLVGYWLAKRLTAPLRSLLPVIDRLGKGEFGIQAPVVTRDEYGKVAEAFNQMSKQLQQAEQVRKNMAADVAHELRTPLTIVQGKLELAQQDGQPIVPENLLPLQDELIRLTRLVDELQQLSLAEAKQLPLEKTPTNLLHLLQRITERIAPDTEQKEIKVTLTSHTNHTTLHIDANRITQVFFNLLVNAIRYTPHGGTVDVVITNSKHSEGGQSSSLQISIADNGIGIDPEHLPNLFNRFYRTDQARTRNSGGMGLGLAIAREFVIAHGGTIQAQSEPGKGTLFTIQLPY